MFFILKLYTVFKFEISSEVKFRIFIFNRFFLRIKLQKYYILFLTHCDYDYPYNFIILTFYIKNSVFKSSIIILNFYGYIFRNIFFY